MINNLRYAVSFPTNGISLSGQLSFQPGSTAITGANGAGKSFIAEMIRYGLFGKKALRGPASDYKSLDMQLDFTVNGVGYAVKRSKKEELVSEEETLAVGADAINKKIVEILGFDLEVFDVVCAANQKESERLTKLTPTRRKELIDDVVGLTAQEAVEKACRDEANGLKREAEALTRALVVPEAPLEPTGYRPSADVAAELDATKAICSRIEELERVIAAVGEEPIAPAEPAVDVEKLEEHEKARVAREAHRSALERQLAGIPDAEFAAEQLDQADALAAYDTDLAGRGLRPDYEQTYLDEQLKLIVARELLSHDSVTCPNCSHDFDPRDPSVDRGALAKLPAPALTRSEIIQQGNRISLWQDAPVEPKGTRMTALSRSNGRLALAYAADKLRLEAELAELSTMEDRSSELAEARQLDKAWDIYTHTSVQHLARFAAAEDARSELSKIPATQHTVAELDAAFVAARVYESQVVAYDQQKLRFDELTAEIGEKQSRAEGFTAGAKGLVEARRTLKAFLAPSLSRVASQLIRQMTVNSRRPLETIHIDEDMNIVADGQDVGTFNGAHATMINLALRLALGQVLVARAFPVFIGDEIDSDADAGNSQAIADALGTCKDQLKQIVLISHKRLENVDNEVML